MSAAIRKSDSVESELKEFKPMLMSLGENRSSDKRVSFENKTPPRSGLQNIMCYNCNQEEHTSTYCRAPCGLCQALGHISRDCPMNRKSSTFAANQSKKLMSVPSPGGRTDEPTQNPV